MRADLKPYMTSIFDPKPDYKAPKRISLALTILLFYSRKILDEFQVELKGLDDIVCANCQVVIWRCQDIPFDRYWSRDRKFSLVFHFLSEARGRDSHTKNPQTGPNCLRELAVVGPRFYALCAVLSNPSCPIDLLKKWWCIAGDLNDAGRKDIRKAIYENPVIDLMGFEEQWALDVVAARNKESLGE